MKKIKINNLITIILSFIISILIAWYILNSLLLAMVYGIFVLLGVMHLQKYKKRKEELFHHIDASYNFVNLMNVQMLSTKNIYEAYKSIENYIDIDFINMSGDELIDHLQEISDEYKLNSFKMYINTLMLYDNEGGNYKEMQAIPTSLCQKTKIYYNQMQKNKFLKFIEITSLYGLWISVLFILQIAIPDYYQSMMNNIYYQLCILAILGFGSFLYYQAFCEYLINKIRGL